MQPTARSTPCSASPTGTEPAECDRSQRTSAPASWASAVIAGQVGDRRRAVVDVAEGDERDVAAMRREDGGDLVGGRAVDRVGVEPGDLAVAVAGEALERRSDRSGSSPGR